MDERFSIRDLAHLFNISHRTIRFYEAEGLLSPARVGQKRIYYRRDKLRLRLIVQGKRLGFSLKEMRELFNLYDHIHADTPEWEADQLRQFLSILASKQAQLEKQQHDLQVVLAEVLSARQECMRALAGLKSQPN